MGHQIRCRSVMRLSLTLIVAACLVYVARGFFTFQTYDAWYILRDSLTNLFIRDNTTGAHLVFVMVDHYEPGVADAGLARHKEWVAHFRQVSDSRRDHYGRRFQYSWFYAYDHRNDAVLYSLNRLVGEGYGEVELHWHHPPSNNTSFPDELAECLAWFHSRGALLGCGDPPIPQYAFIHGNWCLDGSLPLCGVSREIEFLCNSGCWGDFTFSTIGTSAQPRRTNAIYWVSDTPERKSYDSGIGAAVGRSDPGDFLIFEGPTDVYWSTLTLEYGAVESYALPSRRRIECWIDADIHVKGRPEWVFVKVYSHGIQSMTGVVARSLGAMLDDLKAECEERGLKLHFVTAREAYNIVRAAECGKTGDPDLFRDFQLPPPTSRYFQPDYPIRLLCCTPDSIAWEPVD